MSLAIGHLLDDATRAIVQPADLVAVDRSAQDLLASLGRPAGP